MPVLITNICIDAVAVEPVAEFWKAVLGWEVVDRDASGISLGAPGGGMPMLDVLKVPDNKSVKNRVHLDLRANGTTTEQELERLEGLGAVRVDIGQGPDVTWTVLADPEGNEFCLLHRTVQEMNAVA
jgi:predicted enzyme related to lactoylglutathione lyase